MPSSLPVGDMVEALRERLFPSITTWNRLEGRPRTTDLERALRAEVRDALWMLAKQWQMGEFRGSDAGSPVAAKVRIDTTRLNRYRPGAGPAESLSYDVPLEATVERRPVPMRIGGRPVAFDLRLAMGREWLALIDGIGEYRQAFIEAFPVSEPVPSEAADADRCAEPQVYALFAAVAGRALDGGALYEHLIAASSNHAYDGVAGVAEGDRPAIDKAAAAFLAWFERLILQPGAAGMDAWVPAQLDYSFAASAPQAGGGEKVYAADDYGEIRLDWYSLDIDATGTLEEASASEGAEGAGGTESAPGSEGAGGTESAPGSEGAGGTESAPGSEGAASPEEPPAPAASVGTMIPVPVSFAGMPNTRWWAFEDAKTNYGDIDASTTDLAKLLFLEFALVYANDWFVIPYTLPAGTIASVRGVAVTNTFGEHFWIEAADAGPDADWQRWSMFTINVENQPDAAADTSLLLLPTVAKLDHSPPSEEVQLIRDEVANMVWGVETTVPAASGENVPGRQAAQRLLAYYQGLLPAVAPPPTAETPAIRYQVMSSVPENWIPFLPVHVEGSNREIQLQRAAMPRILEGDPNPPQKVQPRTALLRQGLDSTPAQPYFLYEEEVPRAGSVALQCFERARWSDGRVYVWLRVRRKTGRGEGSSGLAFDELVQAPQ